VLLQKPGSESPRVRVPQRPAFLQQERCCLGLEVPPRRRPGTGQGLAAFEFCPSELGTRGAVDLPGSAAKLQNAAEDSVAGKRDGEIKTAWR